MTERIYKAGYILRIEQGQGHAYTPSGVYIGLPSRAKRLCDRGICPQPIDNQTVCSIGFSFKEGKWFGWSHRAICGFKIGSTCRKGDVHYQGVKWTAETIHDAKQMAIDFAYAVS